MTLLYCYLPMMNECINRINVFLTNIEDGKQGFLIIFKYVFRNAMHIIFVKVFFNEKRAKMIFFIVLLTYQNHQKNINLILFYMKNTRILSDLNSKNKYVLTMRTN
jgi:hypothetical protein